MKARTMLMVTMIVALAGVSAAPSAAADFTVVDCLLRDDNHPPEHCVEDCTEEPYDPLNCREHDRGNRPSK